MTLKIFDLRNSFHPIPFVELHVMGTKENKDPFNSKLYKGSHHITKLNHGARRPSAHPFSLLNFKCLAQRNIQPASSNSPWTVSKIRLKGFNHWFFFPKKEYHLNFMSHSLHSIYKHLNITLVLCVYLNNSLYWHTFKKIFFRNLNKMFKNAKLVFSKPSWT